jgi:hypothetical protein
MDTEVLKQLVEIFQTITDGALYALIAYIAYQFVKLFAILFTIGYVFKKLFAWLAGFQMSPKIASMIGFSGYDGKYHSHREKLLKMVQDLKDKK